MILAWQDVRVALATIHVPLREVAPLITLDHISERIASLIGALRTSFGIDRPRIAVLGLNPHAGENGTIGREEVDVIAPAIESMSAADPNAAIEGPFPADGLFGFGGYRQYDGILAMYHDQGLIPLKLLAQGGGVNITAGLRHIRTSPDHGTAFAIAGRNAADPASTMEAIDLAAEMVRRSKR